jgi:uncharacterized repeat protein (TIGR03837 family)
VSTVGSLIGADCAARLSPLTSARASATSRRSFDNPPMRWHLYCRVVDNFGDVGVAWRLAADLASRGEDVRLAVDDASALAWMAPGGAERVEVCGWSDAVSIAADVVVELFGGGIHDEAAKAALAASRPPLIVNVEHLSAEAYVERSHGLPSPRQTSHGRPFTTWYFYPGFVEGTGGLLREAGLLDRREAFDGDAWLASIGVASRPSERRVSLFCYANPAVAPLLEALSAEPTLVLLAPGAATDEARACLGPSLTRGALRAVALPRLSQADFDRLLWSCNLNFVRGEDSLVRAVWAGVPFVWQLYVQADNAHHAKLDAFLDRFLAAAPARLATAARALFGHWNGVTTVAPDTPVLRRELFDDWVAHCGRWRAALAARDGLVTRLIRFAKSKR